MKSESERDRQWADYWAKRATGRTEAVRAGLIILTRQDSRLQVACPYDPLFVALAQGAGATWRYKSKVWSFPSGEWLTGLHAIVKCFGRHRLSPDWLHYLDTENAKCQKS